MKKQSGSSHVFIVIVLVLVLITALGWIFWQNFVHKEPVTKETEIIKVDKDTPQQKKILSFDEWGVKASLSEGLPEIELSYIRNTGENTFYSITTKQPVYNYIENGKTYPIYANVRLYRTSTNLTGDEHTPTQYKLDELAPAKKIGKYYYYFGYKSVKDNDYRNDGVGLGNGTIKDEQTNLQKRQKIEADLVESLKSLQ